jgi:hypothetical protein
MMVWKRILAGLAFVLGVAGLLLSLAAGAGVWIVKGSVTDRATRVFERIEAALGVADRGLDDVESSLARAAERLESAGAEQRALAQEPQQNNAMRRILARKVQQRIAPEVGDAHEKLHAVAEAAVVVNSVLDDVGNLPFLSASGMDVERLAELNRRLAEVGPAAWELGRLFGEPGPDSDAAGAQLSRIEQVLKTMRDLISEYKSQVTQVRQRTEALKARTLAWITAAAVLVSVVCFWIALSQLSVVCHARFWWKQSGRKNP